ncbi:hypothetical protein BJX63DRAFT_406742 [Aspergillus granulosus]|uniref:FAD-binding PCMH-type domain-containing protein n=1 Tax=Aspergillus granulosus TaxID=176169 RepID=A0ABR4H135_9EURO
MRYSSALLLGVSGLALGQTTEPTDFNVTNALYQYGVNVSAIPALSADIVQRSTAAACSAACGTLELLYGSKRLFSQGAAAYSNTTGAYWSGQQEEVDPACIFIPPAATDVSILVLLSRLTTCPFAVKSGGHAAFAGASNIPAGITVLLRDLDTVSLNKDKSVASIGPGLTAVEIYTALEPYGLAVIMARTSSIGVGGFTTGGGVSYYSNLAGWACDNVQSYEVVTPWGVIITASATKNTDIFWALRGGGNNFGIVTKFNMYTIESTELWGGELIYLQSEFPAVISAFIDVINSAEDDGHAQQWLAFVQSGGVPLASTEITYTKNESWPAIFSGYKSITAISDNTAPRSLVEYVEHIELSNPFGLRESYWPHSSLVDEEFANWVVDYWYSLTPTLTNGTSINPVIIFHGITTPMLNSMTKNGGNALGLNASNGPLFIMQAAFMWTDSADDNAVYQFAHDFWETVNAKSKEMGVYHDFIYMNYASLYQDVIASYGATNKARLQKIAASYDPQGVFQTLQPGYFKLDGAPYAYPF